MHRHALRALVVVAIAACGGKTLECERTITNAGHSTAQTRRMIAACESDHWSADVMKCIADALSPAELDACTRKLTYEQYERLNQVATHVNPDAGVEFGVESGVMYGPLQQLDAGRAPQTLAGAQAPSPGCTNTIANPRSRACIAQFCRNNPNDVRCQLE
jgi:hypothetical protein